MIGAGYKNLDLVFCEADGSHMNPALVSQTIGRRLRKPESAMPAFTRCDTVMRRFCCLVACRYRPCPCASGTQTRT